MSIIDTILGREKSETEKRAEEFTKQRQWEREVFDSACRNWVLRSGLGPIMLEQTEEFAQQSGLDGWPDQFDMYDADVFDPRDPEHAELLEYLLERSRYDSVSSSEGSE